MYELKDDRTDELYDYLDERTEARDELDGRDGPDGRLDALDERVGLKRLTIWTDEFDELINEFTDKLD